MAIARRIVIVGGGPAGVGAALAARARDAAAEIVLVSDEPYEPYEAPLSKAVLTGKAMPQDAPIAAPAASLPMRVRSRAARAFAPSTAPHARR
jgi:NADPH-dependent 2,4-dienoyl-CoA reductase/sulfur reductase-like enzyme